MPNIANQPFADALLKVYPAPEGIKTFTASPEANKMLAFWSVKQSTLSQVLRIGQSLFRVVLHKCPHCDQHLSAQAVKMSPKEREIVASLMAVIQAAQPAQAPSKAKPKQAKQAPVPSVEELTLEELDALTAPGGAT